MNLLKKIRNLIKKYLLPRRWLFVDDNRQPPLYLNRVFDVVKNYDEFVEYIETFGVPEVISFDHDLHMEHTLYFFENGGFREPPDPNNAIFTNKTGYDCAKWLLEYCDANNLNLKNIIVHSRNPLGQRNIYNLICNYQMKKYDKINCRIMSWKNLK